MKSLCCLFLVFTLFVRLAPATDLPNELASFSVFGKVDLNELANGKVLTAAGAPMSTPRFLSVQSCFLVAASPAQVMQVMKHFDPTAHRELKVFLHGELPAAPSLGNFSPLEEPPQNFAIKSLATATEKMSPALQLNHADAENFSPGQSPFKFWSALLTKRAQNFANGGASAQPPYDHRGGAIQPAKEIAALVRQQTAVNRQFGGLLGATGLVGSRGSLKPDLYWELLQVEDDGVLTLGASYSRTTAGGGFQSADGLYYATGGYYVVLTLQQGWPMNLGRRAATLMWRGDFISAASLGDLHGIERLASEGATKKDIAKSVAILMKEAGK